MSQYGQRMRQVNHLIQTSSKEIVSGHRCSLQIPQFLNILQQFLRDSVT